MASKASTTWNTRAGRIAVARPHLVVTADDLGGVLHPRDPGEDLRPDRRVRAHDPPLRRGERTGLVEDALGDADLADVVEQEAELGVGVLRRDTDPVEQREPVDPAPLEVLAGV